MGSPAAKFAHFRYTGDGAATKREFKPGWQPKKVTVRSANGSAEWHEGLPQWFKRIAAGDASFLAVANSPAETETGVEWTSTDAQLNANGVVYYVELQG